MKIILTNAKWALLDKYLEMLVGASGDRAFALEFMNKWRKNPEEKSCEKRFLRLTISQKDKVDAHFQKFRGIWANPDECTAADVIEAIEQDKVWCDIIQVDMPDFPSINDSKEIHEAYIAFTKGEMLYKEEKFTQAIPHLLRATQLRPGYQEYIGLLADTYAEDKQWELSLTFYNELIGLFPTDILGYIHRAISFWELGRKEEALSDLNKALSLDPKNEIALINQISILHSMGKLEESYVCIQKAIALFPTNPILLSILNQVEAKAIYDAPKTADDQLMLAALWFLRGDLNKALIVVNRVINSHPDNSKAWYYRGWYKQQQEMWIESIPDLQKAVELDLCVSDYWDILAISLDELGQKDQAMTAYKKALDIDPNFWRTWYNLGVLHMEAERLEEALMCYEKACSLNPEFINSYANAGLVSFQLGELEKAASYYQKAFVLGDDNCLNDWFLVIEKQKTRDKE
ncbi:MAG: tetratricopeptide repeat protein [Bacteroidia bacterium]|nr:tetratricopeptide repeat protein [Bacteroidia bacterium]